MFQVIRKWYPEGKLIIDLVLGFMDLLLRNHCLVDKVLQLLVGVVDAQLLKAVHSQVLQKNTEEP